MSLRNSIQNASRASANSGILTAAGTALAQNNNRISGRIQNLGTNALFVKFGASASTTDFTVVLKAAAGADDGSSPPYEINAYLGLVTVAGTTPRFIASEET